MGGQVDKANRDWLTSQQAENAVAVRMVTNQVHHSLRHPRMNEILQLAIASDDPNRRTTGVGR